MKLCLLLDAFRKKIWIQRSLVLALALVFIGTVLWIFRASIFLWIGFAIFGGIGISVVRYTLSLGISLRFSILRKFMTTVRATRKACHTSAGVQFLHAGAFLVFFGAALILLATKNAPVFQTANIVGLSILALAAAYELSSRINKLIQRAWAKILGKFLSLTIGAAILYFSTALAKHFVHAATQVNPKHFVEFTSILAILFLPFLYLLICAFILGIWALIQIIVLGTFIFISQPVQFLVGCLNKTKREEARLIWFRIRCGKKPKGALPKAPLFSWQHLHLFMRPASIIAAIWILILPFEWANRHSDQIDGALKKTLVFLEYRASSRCVGMPNNIRVAYLDGDFVSTVKDENGIYIFGISTCKIAS